MKPTLNAEKKNSFCCTVAAVQAVKGCLWGYNSWSEYETLLKLMLCIIHASYLCDMWQIYLVTGQLCCVSCY